MPIYAYKCASCGHAKDVLQKISDAPLTLCPQCGKSTFVKQVTAAGFQLKGSGWYVTDFRGGSGSSAAAPPDANGKADAKPAETQGGATKTEAKPAAKSQASNDGAPAAAPVPPSAPSSSGN